MTPTSPCHSRAITRPLLPEKEFLQLLSCWKPAVCGLLQQQSITRAEHYQHVSLAAVYAWDQVTGLRLRTIAESLPELPADWGSSLKAVDGLASEGLAWAGLKQGGQQQFRHVWWTLAGSGREDIGGLDYAIHFHADSRPTNLLQSLEAKDTTRQRFQLNTVEKLCS